jgi:pimeloyl-ACP methyl ester carboxylesterase
LTREQHRTVTDDGVGITWHRWVPESAPPATGRAYRAVRGEVPVVLVHGFVSSTIGNWENTGVVDALVDSGRVVMGIDVRGHGRSDAPHDPAFYGEARMAEDVQQVMDRLRRAEYDLVGYSMGAIISLLVAAADTRIRRLVVGGVGAGVVELGGLDTRHASMHALVDALTTDDPDSLPAAVRGFRRMADANGSDRFALAAHASVRHASPIDLAAIDAATLVLAGADDPLAVRPEVLVDAIPDARLHLVRGDHLGALRDPAFTEALVEHVGAQKSGSAS